MVSLKINNEFVDLKGGEEIAITFQNNDVGDISTRNGSYSTSYSIPTTNHNISLLGYINNLGVISLSNPSKRYTAELYNKGAFLKSGFIKVNSVSKDDINITFYGDNVSWFELIKDKKLNELNLSEFNHNWTALNIIATWVESWTWEDGYTYPITERTGTILNGVAGKNLPLTIENMRIAVYVKQLIKKIIESVGFSITGSVWNKDVNLNNLILPFTGDSYELPPPSYQDNSKEYSTKFVFNQLDSTATAAGGSAKVINQFWEDNDTYWDYESNSMIVKDVVFMSFDNIVTQYGGYNKNYISGYSTYNSVIDAGGGEIRFSFDQFINQAGANDNPSNGDTIILKGGLYDQNTYVINSHTSTTVNVTGTFLGDSEGLISTALIGRTSNFAIPYYTINGVITKYYTTTPVALLPNDYVEFYIENKHPTNDITDFGSDGIGFISNITPDYENSINGGVNINIALPDITQGDLLNNVLFSLGAVVSTNDQTKEISIDYFDDIINNIPNAKNWSSKIDKSKKSGIDYSKYISNYGKTNNVLYAEDSSDQDIINYNNRVSNPLGSGKITVDNDFLTSEKTLFTSVFSATGNAIHEQYKIPLIKCFEDSLAPRILLVKNGLTMNDASNGFINQVTIDGNITQEVQISWFTPNNFLFDKYKLLNLSFGDDSGLLDTYFNTLLSTLNSGALVKENILLSDNDIRELDFLTPIRLDQYQSYFYINKINQYKGSDKSTVVELIKIA
jgi:hypothetical protein